jgi:succinyl-CoA synthetase beta subunit
MIVHEVIRAKGDTLFSESVTGGVEVSHVSKEQKEALIAGRVKKVRSQPAT